MAAVSGLGGGAFGCAGPAHHHHGRLNANPNQQETKGKEHGHAHENNPVIQELRAFRRFLFMDDAADSAECWYQILTQLKKGRLWRHPPVNPQLQYCIGCLRASTVLGHRLHCPCAAAVSI
jgi:hypothetical protein